MMSPSFQPSPFIDAAAVEAWDAWFRWRDHGQLRDVSIDATWQRITNALIAVETELRDVWTQQIFAAISHWQLILDERLLSSLGTGLEAPVGDLVAVLNAAAFVCEAGTSTATLDFNALRDVAGLAVRCLDNATILQPATDLPSGLRIGFIGVADALALLGIRFDSASARTCAAQMANALAEGCLIANVRLAKQRGAQMLCDQAVLHLLQRRAMPAELIASANEHGLRYAALTAITSQPRLALFANNVADALDPISAKITARTDTSHTHTPVSIEAQIKMRGAMQSWIDAPIEYPIRVECDPDAFSARHFDRLAAALDLGELRWSHA